jgi:hypothetical protein
MANAVYMEIKIMSRYCLEKTSETPIIHRVDCPAFELATLLVSGKIVDIGEYKSSLLALQAVKGGQSCAIRCLDCCYEKSAVYSHYDTFGRSKRFRYLLPNAGNHAVASAGSARRSLPVKSSKIT